MTYTSRFAIPSPEEIRKRIPVYDRPGPRYTSYPTAPVFSEEFGEADFKRALGRCRSATLSLYIHIPFCERLCSFCACNRTITRDHSVATAYLDALDREVDLAAAAIGGSPRAVQLAIGGGTPTFLSPEELARLCQIVDSRFPAADSAERSIEVDPRVTTREQLEVLAERGFNRISLGVQDFTAVVQEAIRRVQSREQTEAVATAARELGMGSVNFDLIYGLPFQTVESFCETVDQVIRIRPDRIALYSYAHVTWISKQQRGFEKKDLPEPERKVAILLAATERFEKATFWARRSLERAPGPLAIRTLAASYAHLDRPSEARSALEEELRLEPDLTLSKVRHQNPSTDPDYLERWLDGLRKAGLKE